MQASTALPIFYKPARIGGVDYVDGGIRNTANIDVAIEKGADLVICYNPFRPFLNRIDAEGRSRYFAAGRYLSDRGLKMLINQVFRTMLHSRLRTALRGYLSDDRFRGDIVPAGVALIHAVIHAGSCTAGDEMPRRRGNVFRVAW